MWLNWPLDLTGWLPYRHLLPVPSVQEGPSDGQHGVTGLWPERGEDFVNDRVLNAKRPSFMLCLFSFVYIASDNQNKVQSKTNKSGAVLTTKVKPSIVATLWPLVTFTVWYDGVKFPLNTGEHWISVHLNTTPHQTYTQTGHYTTSHPAFILIQWSSTALQ